MILTRRTALLVATLLQTVATLYRIHNFHDRSRLEPFALVTTSADNTATKTLCTFWSPTILDLQRINNDNNYAIQCFKSVERFENLNSIEALQTNAYVSNGWTISCSAANSRRTKPERFVDFVVVHSIDQISRIRWIKRRIS